MSSQQGINCDTYTIEANNVSIKSSNAPMEFNNIKITGEIEMVSADPLAEPNIKTLGAWAEISYLDIKNVPGSEYTGGIDFAEGTHLGMPKALGRVASSLYIEDTGAVVADNSFNVTGPFLVLTNLLFLRLMRIGGFVFYDIRMLGGQPVAFTATNATITTEASIPAEYLPTGLDYLGVNPSTVIPLQALINGVIVNLMGKIINTGALLITRPGGTFTSGETIYLLEASGTWASLI